MAWESGPPPQQRLRVIAIGVLVYRDHLLCARGHDSVKDETFYRPLGGEVEFGEWAKDAVVREFREEIGRDVEMVEPLGTVENIFTLRGETGHEVVLEFIVRFAPGHEPPDLEPLAATEDGAPFEVVWLPLAEVLAGVHRVYPDALIERLAGWVNRL